MILLFIACFDWKIDIFQKTVARVYYIRNITILIFVSFTWQYVFLEDKVCNYRVEVCFMGQVIK